MPMKRGSQNFKSFATKAAASKFAKKYRKSGYGASVKASKDKWGKSYMVRYYRKR